MSDLALLHYTLVFAATSIGVAVLTPLGIAVARRLGLLDQPASRKFHQHPTPYVGGVAVAVAVLVALLVPAPVRGQTLLIAASALGVALIGGLDDWKTLNPQPRLAVQALAAGGLWLADVRLTPTGWAPVDIAATVFFVVAVTNALNLVDNMDGLAAGVGAIAAAFFFVVAFWHGQRLVAFLAAVLAGACVGFLPYNFSGARVFLGDNGALFIGFLLAALAVKIDVPGQDLLTRAAVPWLILALPLFDMTFVIVSRVLRRRPVFQGATDHSSHRLVALGLSPRQSVLVAYLVGGAGGGAALALVRSQTPGLGVAVVVGALAIAAVLGLLLERVHTVAAPMNPQVAPEARDA